MLLLEKSGDIAVFFPPDFNIVINPRTPKGVDITPWRFSPVTCLMIPIAKIASFYLLLGVGDTF